MRGEKPQNRPLSNLNNLRFALLAMLPVENMYKKQQYATFLLINLARKPFNKTLSNALLASKHHLLVNVLHRT